MSKKVVLEVSPDGKTTISAEGYGGGACLDATAVFEDMFRKTDVPREMTGECAAAGQERVLR